MLLTLIFIKSYALKLALMLASEFFKNNNYQLKTYHHEAN